MARVTSPPARVVPVAAARASHAVEQLEAAVLVEVGGDAEDDVGLAGLGAHRRQVGERRGQRLVADLGQARLLAAEVDAVDEGVDRGRGGAAGHGDRGVVAAAEADPRARGGQPFPYPRQQLELAHRPFRPR